MGNDISHLSTHSFELIYSYIRSVARQAVPHFIGPFDYEDVVQEAFLKLWRASQKQYITFPEAYIRKIVHSVKVDMLRKYQPNLYLSYTQLLDNEYEDGFPDSYYLSDEAEKANPEYAFLEKEAVCERINALIDGLAMLHARQKHATVATLRQRGADVEELVQALTNFDRTGQMKWPVDKHKKQTLQASFTPARKKLARMMKVDLTSFK